MYHVVYTDGDEEDYDDGELQYAIDLHFAVKAGVTVVPQDNADKGMLRHLHYYLILIIMSIIGSLYYCKRKRQRGGGGQHSFGLRRFWLFVCKRSYEEAKEKGCGLRAW